MLNYENKLSENLKYNNISAGWTLISKIWISNLK